MIRKLFNAFLALYNKAAQEKEKALYVFVVCFFAECIRNPSGAINTFAIHCIDAIIGFFPSTPAEYKLSGLFASYQSTNPAVSAGLLLEVFNLTLPIFAIYLAVKLYKFLPFT